MVSTPSSGTSPRQHSLDPTPYTPDSSSLHSGSYALDPGSSGNLRVKGHEEMRLSRGCILNSGRWIPPSGDPGLRIRYTTATAVSVRP
eukprot:2367696-Rhodomonas_salina.2